MLSDTLTIGLVLVLLFGSIALYLYTCIQQSEQKVSLLESILLDLKMSAEVKSYAELPMDTERPLDTVRPSDTGRPSDTEERPLEVVSSNGVDTANEESYEPFEEEDSETLPAEEVIEIDDDGRWSRRAAIDARAGTAAGKEGLSASHEWSARRWCPRRSGRGFWFSTG